MQKKGVSETIEIILLILLVLAIIVIFWQFYTRMIRSSTEEINLDIFSIDLRIKGGEISNSDLSINVKRQVGAGNLLKARLLLLTEDNGQYIIDKQADIAELETKKVEITSDDFSKLKISYKNLTEIQIAPIIGISSGNEKIGMITDKHKINWCNGADINRDGKVDQLDNATYNLQYPYHRGCQNIPTPNSWCNGIDVNRDNKIDNIDLELWQGCYCPLGWDANGVSCMGSNNNHHTYEECKNIDVSKDGKVDGAEVGLWQQNYAPTYNACEAKNSWCERADINHDGLVDLKDLAIINANWGRTDCI